nr:putative reverse transcriptase domain, zinc finger, CCHC-type, aspartic peptidase domain protein [Tanacetum cinerariifolium]
MYKNAFNKLKALMVKRCSKRPPSSAIVEVIVFFPGSSPSCLILGFCTYFLCCVVCFISIRIIWYQEPFGDHGNTWKKETPARDPRDVEMIERLLQRIQKLEFQQLQKDSPAEETETDSNDIWDEEEEYLFVNEYPSFKEEPIMFVEDESCPVYDTDNEEESMPVYDTDIEDVIEDDGNELRVRENNHNVLYDGDASFDGGSCENTVATTMLEKLGLDVEGHPAPYQLTWLKKENVVKVRSRVLTKREFELLGHYNVSATFIVSDLSPYSGESEYEENSRTSFSQAGEDDAGELDRNVNLVEYLEF